MKFAVAAALAISGVNAVAVAGNGTIIVTEVVPSYVTYCPGPTEITHGHTTYTVTEATTLTITNCPGGCTITRPVTTSSVVVCHTCTQVPTAVPPPPPPHNNGTVPVPPTQPAPPTKPAPPTTPPTVTPPPNSGAGKAMAVSGAGLAGLLAVAAFL